MAGALSLFAWGAMALGAQTSGPTSAVAAPSHADILRGGYGPYRANNDLLFYHLDIRVDPEKKFISGKNTIRFKMLEDGTRIQLELYPSLEIDRIVRGHSALKYERDGDTVFVDFPKTLRKGR
ncbi:MAG: M1 family peptidase, partial [Edaphobacter sp.]